MKAPNFDNIEIIDPVSGETVVFNPDTAQTLNAAHFLAGVTEDALKTDALSPEEREKYENANRVMGWLVGATVYQMAYHFVAEKQQE